jgi:hypothetical protein
MGWTARDRAPLNIPLDRGRGVAAGVALLVVLALAAFAVASRSPQWTLVFVGGLLLAAGFLVMARGHHQLSGTLTGVLREGILGPAISAEIRLQMEEHPRARDLG